ncbi:MAG: MBL fold metallo-hydrolase RNA specificity domain-containing protein, partial [Candidatus Bipolaricaulaceae bacterium]
GYQAEGTLGRAILDGASEVEVLGSWVPVRAAVWRIEGLSAHADQEILLDWAMHADPGQVFLVHGEPQALGTLAARLASLGYSVHIPSWQETVEL